MCCRNRSRPIEIKNHSKKEFFNDLSFEDQQDALKHAPGVLQNVFESQLKTQSNVITFCANSSRIGFETLPDKEINLDSLTGRNFFVPKAAKVITISDGGYETDIDTSDSPVERSIKSVPFVFTEIETMTVVNIECRISQLTITRCKNLNIRFKNAPIAGI